MSNLQLFQKGVKNWMLRSKHGRDRIFKTPEDLWQGALEYFKSVDDNPWYKIDISKGGESAGDMYEIPTILPYTIQGMCSFWNVSSVYFYDFKRRAKEKKEESFMEVIYLIEDTIYNRKYIGAAAGFFNAQFIGKDIGLVDRSLVGSDPDNPLPAANVVQFYIPNNNRASNTHEITGQVIEQEFKLD
jgi:hypothetical protein